MQIELVKFSVVDRKAGRTKRTIVDTGTVGSPMQLRDFPFDMDEITVMFRTVRSGARSTARPQAT